MVADAVEVLQSDVDVVLIITPPSIRPPQSAARLVRNPDQIRLWILMPRSA